MKRQCLIQTAALYLGGRSSMVDLFDFTLATALAFVQTRQGFQGGVHLPGPRTCERVA